MRIETYWNDNGKYFCASTIIIKYGLPHTINIIYMGLLIIIIMLWINMDNAGIKYERINDADKYQFISRRGFGIFRSPKLDLQIF